MRQRDADGAPTLGVFKPKRIKRLVIESDAATWSPEQQETLAQRDLFRDAPREELEKIPHSFRYEFECEDNDCRGHTIACTDWEIGELWRKCHRVHGDGWEGPFRKRAEAEMIEQNDTHFFVGTVHRFPATWIIVGLFYPRPSPGNVAAPGRVALVSGLPAQCEQPCHVID